MAVLTAVEFIQKWDYLHATDDHLQRFEEQKSDFPRRHVWQEDDLKMALKHLKSVASSPNFPMYDTGPAKLTIEALEWILRETTQENDEAYHELYQDFLVACMTAGPSLAQIEMLLVLIRTTTVTEYFSKLKGEKLSQFLRVVKKEFRNSETIPKDFASSLTSLVKSCIIDGFSNEQYLESRGEFLQLMMFYQSLVPNCEKHMADFYNYLVSTMEQQYKKEVWKIPEGRVPNHECLLLREQLKQIDHVVGDKEFPSFPEQADVIKPCLRNVLSILIENRPYFDEFLEDVVKLMCTTCVGEYEEPRLTIVDCIHTLFNKLDREKKEYVAKKPKLFEKYAPIITGLINKVPHPGLLGKMIRYLYEYFLLASSGGADSHFKQWVQFLTALISQPDTRYLDAAKGILEKQKKILKWKNDVEGVKKILITIGKVKFIEKQETTDHRKRQDEINPYRVAREQADVMEKLLEQVKFCKVVGRIQKELLSLIKQYLDDAVEDSLWVAKECAEFKDIKDELDLALPLIDTFDRQFKNEDFPWTNNATTRMTMDILSKVIQSHKDSKQFEPYCEKFVSIFKTAMTRDYWDHESGNMSVFGYAMIGPLVNFGVLFRDGKNMDALKPLLGDMVRMLTCDEDDISDSVGRIFMMVAMSEPSVFAPHLEQILEAYFEREDTSLIDVMKNVYKWNPKPVDDNFEKIFELLDSVENNHKSNVIALLSEVAQRNSSLFTEDNITHLFGEFMSSQTTEALALQLLQKISENEPGKLESHIDELFDHIDTLMGAAMIPMIVVNVADKNEKYKKTAFDRLIVHLKKSKGDYTTLVGPLNSVRVLAGHDRELLSPEKQLFEDLGEKHANLKEMCKYIIDVIEGRSVENITDIIGQQQEDLEQLDTRVANTENEIIVTNQEVDKQGKKIGEIRQDVNKQGEKLEELGEVVDETVLKVEEIDNKTLNNAPVWSRDVSKLLNPEAEHDWRLLAQRLGYSNDDIRGWGTQHDPCMSMLSEWFATHKTSEATRAVLKTLEEIDRLDASEIVGRAMQSVENVVQDEPPEYESPPPIFISYQWGHQPEVRLLRKHLEMAGFESWMDIGQMGGGDKLYEKIDEGIRAAKVVICCVTEKYSKSPNCNREVNLAVNLGKPVVPLLLEQVSWPPPGAMGPIFGEYLYIQFFHRDASQKCKDETVWPAPKFQELLMQLSYMQIIPVESKVAKEYKNWWLPAEEQIVLPKRQEKKSEMTTTSGSQEVDELQPDIFLSYQWDKQPQVKALYKTMTELGYHCWLDIYQMGGGDSLYDKIDRGLRGCKVVVACVTEKYSKSANCRREVSLADAIKKPIIPLLLQETTWPPSGPMSMIFAQLLYIKITDPKSQETWTGASFEELRSKMESYLRIQPAMGVGKNNSQDGNVAPEKANDAGIAKQRDSSKNASGAYADNSKSPEKQTSREKPKSPEKPKTAQKVTEPGKQGSYDNRPPVAEKPTGRRETEPDVSKPQNVAANPPRPYKEKKSKSCTML